MKGYHSLRPMLAEVALAPFDSDRHSFEIKWDGYRALARVEGGGCALTSRHGRDLTADFPSLQGLGTAVKELPAVLDGEVVALDRQGRSRFDQLRRGRGPVVYVAFDLLVVGGVPVMHHPWHERRARLEASVAASASVLLSPVVRGAGRSLYRAVVEQELEGMMAKDQNGPYLPGKRSRYWLKIRNTRTLDCVIAGFTRGRGQSLGALVVGCYGEDGLVLLGHVGTGFSEGEAVDLLARLRARTPQPAGGKGVVWVEPDLVCSVEYLELMPGLKLRQAVFRGLRSGVDPTSCRLPQAKEVGNGAPGQD